MRRRLNLLLATTAMMPLGLSPSLAGSALPQGGQVQVGSATVTTQGSTLTVNQTTNNAVINWNTFNIGAGGTVTIKMPGPTSVELDRVTGGLGPSQIFGSLNSNGIVYLVNPNGMLFGRGASVNAAGFLATTHDIANSDFMAGRYNFNISGNPAASIVNRGAITAASGGFAALVAPGVRNSGTITATLGTVGLASANGFTLDFYGDRLITLAVNDAIATKVMDVATGKPLSSLVSNTGKLSANGGKVVLTAAAARSVVDSVINTKGVIEANAIGSKGGTIVLAAATGKRKPAGAPAQTIKVAGTLSAAGKNAGQKGGKIKITGENIALAGATLDASGQARGGTVRIGRKGSAASAAASPGGRPGATASTVTIDAASVINASATGSGNGGQVSVWANDSLTVAGLIKATGGAQGGNGGSVETSGGAVNFAGIGVNTSAPAGRTGTWLVDPTNLTVDSAAATTISSNLATTGVTLQTNANGTTSGPGTASPGPGDIIVNAPISWTSANTLTLNAYHAIDVNATITVTGAGGLVLAAANNPLAPAAPLLSFGNGGSVQYTGTPNSGQSLAINGQPYTLLYSMSDVQNVNATSASLAGNYALAKPLNASRVESWTPIGTDGSGNILNSGNGFAGSFQGLGNTISNLTVNLPSSNHVGLFGYVGTNGVIANVGLIGGSVSGEVNVGGLVGVNYGTVTQSYATGAASIGSVAGNVGGLVGLNNGTVTQSYAAAPVSSGNGPDSVGGLVGYNTGAVSQSYATGAVSGGTGPDSVGGLVGYNTGAVSQSYAAGAVSGGSGSNNLGGLVGYNTGAVSQSYANGAVSGGSGSNNLGGLVGYNTGTVSQSYAAGAVISGSGSNNLGGLVGLNDSGGNVSSSYWDTQATGQPNGFGTNNGTFSATGLTTGHMQDLSSFQTTYSGWDFQNVWAPPNQAGQGGQATANYPQLYALTPVVWNAANNAISTYGSAIPTLTATSFGGPIKYVFGPSGDTLNVPASLSTTATQTSNSGSYAIVNGSPSMATSADGVVYRAVNTDAMLTINAAPVTVTALGGSSTYGGSPANPGLTATGLQNGQGVGVLTGLSNSFGITNLTNAGAYTLNVAGANTNTNYTVTATVPGSWTVNAAPVTVTALGGSSTYGGSPANPGLTATGLQNGQGVGVLTGLSNSFGISNLTNAGTYTLNVAGANTNTNYTVTATVPGSWTVNAAPVTVTALGGSSTYGGSPANPGLTATGLQNGQGVGVLTGLSNSFGIGNLTNAGAYTLNVAGANTNTNYTVTATVPGLWTVNAAPVTVTALGGSSTYGGSPANPGLSATGLQNGQGVGVLTGLSNSFGISNLTNAGTYTLNVAGTNTNTNYTVTATVPGSWTVNAAPVTVTALGGSSTYGGSPSNPGLSATGLQNGQGVGVLTGLSNSFGISNLTNAGTRALNVAGTNTNTNYIVTAMVPGSWTVNAAPVTVTALGGSSTYGGSPANPGLTATGLQNGQGVGVLTGLSNSFAISNLTNAGTYALNVAGTNTNTNYTVTATVPGSWTVNAAPVTVTALGGSSTYGGSPANPGLTATGLQNGQGVGVLTGLSNSFAISNLTNAGTYALNVAGTNTNTNYTVTATVPGSWTVNAAPVTVTALGGSSTYGGSPANPGLTATGLQNGQGVGVLTGLSNSFGISNLTNAGTYALNVAGANTNTNYIVTATVPGSWTVNPATLTYVANPASTTSGAAIPPLSGSVTGFVNGQTLASATTGVPVFSTAATPSSNAGSYPITGSGLTADNGNYVFVQAPGNATALTITPAPGIVNASATSPTATGNFGVQQTAQFAQVVQPAVFNPNTPPPLVTPVALGVPPGGGLGGGPGGGPGAAGGSPPGPGEPFGTLANGRQGGNGAPPGVRLIDMPVMPLPPGTGMPPPGETRFSPTEVVLQFGAGVTAQQIAQIDQRFCVTLVATQPIAMLGRAVYTCSIANGRTVREVIRLIEAARLRVGGARLRVAVQPNYTYTLLQEPTAGQPSQPAGTSPEPPVNLGDPAQYIVQKLQLGEAQRIAKGDNVVIAVIDSEIDAMHPDLAGVVTSRYDAGCGATAPDAHGTGMTGAIASHAHLLGVAPNAKVIAICAFGGGAATQATSSSVNILNGLGYAVAQGARIVNMSFAGPYDKALAQALQVAREKGVLLIGAAGNAGPKSPPLYPGADPNVMAVTATDPDDHLFNGANQGKYVTVAAPGVDVLVPAPNEGVQLSTGTSVATAEVSGVAALLLGQRPSRTPMEIRATLTSTAKHLGAKGINPQFGAGLVDPLKALRLPPAPVSQIPAPVQVPSPVR